jgi:hypothetical protein
MQLAELREINNPDYRTRREIEILKARLGKPKINLELGRPARKKCSGSDCGRMMLASDRYKQCAFCRARKLRYEKHRKKRSK